MFGRFKFRPLSLLPLVFLLLFSSLASAKEGEGGDGAPPPATGDGLLGSYFPNINLEGDPALVRVDPKIDFPGTTSSLGPGIPAFQYSVRWTGQVLAQHTEEYTFTTINDDGARLWVNGQLLIDDWNDHPPTRNSGTLALEAGKKYDIKLEYFEGPVVATIVLLWSSESTSEEVIPTSQLFSAVGNRPPHASSQSLRTGKNQSVEFTLGAGDADGDALSYVIMSNPAHGSLEGTPPNLKYTPETDFLGVDAVTFKVNDGHADSNTGKVNIEVAEGDAGQGLTGDYFDNMDLEGDPKVTRIDPTVDFDWGIESPDPDLPSDNFSARWSGQVQPRFTETYTFHTTSDDGVRLWVNDQLLIDNWTDHGPMEDTGSIDLEAGHKYDIRMEFYERGGGALARLEWSSESQGREVVPAERLFPKPGGGSDNEGPSITDVSLEPTELPSKGGSFTVKAKASDPDGVKSVVVRVTLQGSGQSLLDMEKEGDFYVLRGGVGANPSREERHYSLVVGATDNKGNLSRKSAGNITVAGNDEQFNLVPGQVSVRPLQTIQFHVSGPGQFTLKWSVEGGDENGTIDQAGRYTAPAAVPAARDIKVHALVNGEHDLTANVHLITNPDGRPILYAKQPLSVQRGSSFNLDINLAPDFKIGVAAVQFNISFPPSALQLDVADPINPVEITSPGNVIPDSTLAVKVVTPGQLRIAIAGPRNSTKAGTLLRIPLKVSANVPIGARIPVHLANVAAFNEKNKQVQIEQHDGFVAVMDNVSCGDVDQNTHVEVGDAVMALRSVVGLVTLNPDEKRAADTNHDGQVTAGDVVTILRISIGLDETCTPGPTPRG